MTTRPPLGADDMSTRDLVNLPRRYPASTRYLSVMGALVALLSFVDVAR